jgi:CRP-like cAMP-binding protein
MPLPTETLAPAGWHPPPGDLAGLGGSAPVDLRVDLRHELADGGDSGRPLPARVLALQPGAVDLDPVAGSTEGFGLMVLEGLLFAELGAGRASIGSLLGRDDVLAPAAMRERALTDDCRWRALTPIRAAVLDDEFVARAGRSPHTLGSLIDRATRTTNWTLSTSLAASAPLVEDRLLLLFALLGERWGRVTGEGVALRLPLTHAMLGAMCGARRPSVTVALHALEQDGLIECCGKGRWLLHGSRSEEVPGRASCLSKYERALGLDRPGQLGDTFPQGRYREA